MSKRVQHARLAAATLACVGLLVCAAPACAATPPPGFFGLGGWSYPTDQQAAQLAGDGLRLVRGAIGWGNIQPTANPASRNWSNPDRLARDAANDGFDLIFVLNGCAVWACGTVNAPPTGAALTQYESFVSAAVSRYGPASAFWRGLPRIPHVSWQVWNEVNGGYFWPNPTPAAYAAFLAQTDQTIKAADPTATVVMSGLDEFPSQPGGVPLTTFLDGLYDQPGFTSSFDVAAVHGYAANPVASVHILDEARRVILQHGDASRPLWMTEIGWASAGPLSPFTADPPTQASYLTSAWDTMLACSQRWNLQHVLWFSLQDVSASWFGEPDYWGFNDGLLTVGGVPKPAFEAFLPFIGSGPLPNGGGSSCTLPGGMTVLTTDPAAQILSAPSDTRHTSRVFVRFRSNEAGVHFQCSLDETPWISCTSPFNVSSHREGIHNLLVRAIDFQANVEPTPASVSWLVDLTPPDTIITSRGPYGSTNRALTITFAGLDAGGLAYFQCRVDRGKWRRCRSPFTTHAMPAGRHRVWVRAVDRAGNVDPTPAYATFVVRPRLRARR